MVKLYRHQAAAVLLLLKWCRENDFAPPLSRLREDTRERGLRDLLAYADREGEGVPEIDDLIDLLSKQVGKETEDGDLIDLMVRILNLPFTRNAITADTLAALKKAILLPEEITSLKEVLKKVERRCSICDHKFVGDEIGSFRISGQGDVTLQCTNCRTPIYQACRGCGKGSAPISTKIHKLLRKEDICAECVQRAKEDREAANNPTPTPTPPIPDEAHTPPPQPAPSPSLGLAGGTLRPSTISSSGDLGRGVSYPLPDEFGIYPHTYQGPWEPGLAMYVTGSHVRVAVRNASNTSWNLPYQNLEDYLRLRRERETSNPAPAPGTWGAVTRSEEAAWNTIPTSTPGVYQVGLAAESLAGQTLWASGSLSPLDEVEEADHDYFEDDYGDDGA